MAAEEQKQKLQVDIKSQAPSFQAGIENLRRKAEYGNRQEDTTIVNSTGANASLRLQDHKINLAGSQDTGIKVNEQQSNFQSFEEKHTTNRFNLDTYEIVINGHKLNPNLWEYTDMSEFKDAYQTRHAVGGFCLFGTVLCPSWDEQLGRYVLIRRLTRMPMFSPKLNVPEIMKQLNIEDPTKVSYEYGYKQSTESAESFQKKAAAKVKKAEEKKDGDAEEAGPNGRHYFENDIAYLMDKNRDMTREQAIGLLSKDGKYTKEWSKENGYEDSDADAKPAEEPKSTEQKTEPQTAGNGKTVVNEADIEYHLRQQGMNYPAIDPAFKTQVIEAMVNQIGSYGPERAALNVRDARERVRRQQGQANQQYAKWLNEIAYYMASIDFRKG